MKTIRTIIGTLAGVLLAFALVAWFSVRRNAAFIQRTIYQGFDQTFVVALVMGCAFLLIAVILTVAIVSTSSDDDEDDEDQPEAFRPRTRPHAQAYADQPLEDRRPAFRKGEEPYRRVSRTRAMDQERTMKVADSAFARPKEEAEDKPAPRKRSQAPAEADQIPLRGEDAPVKKKKAPRLEAEDQEEPKPRTRRPRAEAEAEEEAKPKVKRPKAEPEAEPEPKPRKAKAEPEAEPEAQPKPKKARAAEEAQSAEKAEAVVRCVFCGGVMGRDERVCPTCGKQR